MNTNQKLKLDQHLLPIKYRIEIYEESLRNDPSVSFETSAPFLAIHEGDYLHPGTINERLGHPATEGKALRVKGVEHIIWEVGSQVGHSLSVCIEVVDRPEDLFGRR